MLMDSILRDEITDVNCMKLYGFKSEERMGEMNEEL